MFYGGGYGGGYGSYGSYGGACSYGYGYGCGLFDWDISYWIYFIVGLLVFFVLLCLLCSPCCCTALAACLAGFGINKKKSSSNKQNQQPTIITTQPYVTGQQPNPTVITTHQPAPLEQKNITIYESNNVEKPIPKERRKKEYREGSEILSEDRYYSSRKQRLERTPPYVDRSMYTQQNERYYGGRTNY